MRLREMILPLFLLLSLAAVIGAVVWVICAASTGGSSSASTLHHGPVLPATHFKPLTSPVWVGTNYRIRIVRVQNACYVEVKSGDNFLDARLTPTACPKGH